VIQHLVVVVVVVGVVLFNDRQHQHGRLGAAYSDHALERDFIIMMLMLELRKVLKAITMCWIVCGKVPCASPKAARLSSSYQA
jgi:hypothetical protein